MQKNNLLVWIDLEMTGLEWQQDTILEAALIITDENLQIIYPGVEIAIHQPDSLLETMGSWQQEYFAKNGLIEKVKQSNITLSEAQNILLDIIKEYCLPRTAVLCGNSIWQDRAFLKYHMSHLDSFLYYRMIDVIAIKELVKRWFKSDLNTIFIQTDTHR